MRKFSRPASLLLFLFYGLLWAQFAPFTLQTKLTKTPVIGDMFGIAVDLYGDRMAIGAKGDDQQCPNCGAVFIYRYNSSTQTWDLEQKLLPPTHSASYLSTAMSFGSVLALHDNRLIVGQAENARVFIFEFNGSSWNSVFSHTGSGRLGMSVDLKGDWAIAGAPYFDGAEDNQGQARIFFRNSGVWGLNTSFSAPSPAEDQYLGDAVAIASDLAVVADDLDHVFVYRFTGTWGLQSLQTGPISSGFGDALAAQEDQFLVGAPYDASNGRAFLYRWNGSSWVTTPFSASDGAAFDLFGDAVDLAPSGDTLMVGAPSDDDAGSASGSAYIYSFNGVSWTQTKITATDADANDNFGSSVGVHGLLAVAGAFLDETTGPSNSGSAYTYVENVPLALEQPLLQAHSHGASTTLSLTDPNAQPALGYVLEKAESASGGYAAVSQGIVNRWEVPTPDDGRVFYRVQRLGADGQRAQSNTVEVRGALQNLANGRAFNLYPNPSDKRVLTVEMPGGLIADLVLRVRTPQGTEVFRETITGATGEPKVMLPNLSGGIYLVDVVAGDYAELIRLVLH